MSKLKTKWINTSAAIGGADIESTSDGVIFTNEQVDMIETGLTSSKEAVDEAAANKAKVVTLTADLAAANAAKKTAEEGAATLQGALTETEGKLTAATTKLTEATTEITDLKAKLSGKPLNTTRVKGTGGEGDAPKTYSSVDKAASQVD